MHEHRTAPVRTGAVVALKRLDDAKSRFAGISAETRRELVWAMATDTLRAASAASDLVVLVTDEVSVSDRLRRSDLATRSLSVLADPGDGLNASFSAGCDRLREHGCELVACVMADLPTLTAAALGQVWHAARYASAPVFVRDADDLGTTVLAGRPAELVPRFGGASARRHRDHGAVDLVETDQDDRLTAARFDVDDHAALGRAYAFGLGPSTARICADAAIPAGDRPGSLLSC